MVAGVVARSVDGQTTATLSGTVTNEAWRPLEQALVTLDPQGANPVIRTDARGSFSWSR